MRKSFRMKIHPLLNLALEYVCAFLQKLWMSIINTRYRKMLTKMFDGLEHIELTSQPANQPIGINQWINNQRLNNQPTICPCNIRWVRVFFLSQLLYSDTSIWGFLKFVPQKPHWACWKNLLRACTYFNMDSYFLYDVKCTLYSLVIQAETVLVKTLKVMCTSLRSSIYRFTRP